ncbi:MAG: type II secretion system protein [Verrucomicrobia bacterium]|nr:type II secretion system protein [Verrucomicrobiota bacterium]
MKSPSTSCRSHARSARGGRRAFSLIEIMITLTIISLLAAISMPTLKSVKRRTAATAIGNDLRTFAAAFDGYVHETGAWPAETAAGVLPPEMAARINPTAWLRATPLGGQYNWDNNQMHAGNRYKAAIAISDTAASPFIQDVDLLEAIDRIIDDGNLATGNFRIGADDEPVFIVAP